MYLFYFCFYCSKHPSGFWEVKLFSCRLAVSRLMLSTSSQCCPLPWSFCISEIEKSRVGLNLVSREGGNKVLWWNFQPRTNGFACTNERQYCHGGLSTLLLLTHNFLICNSWVKIVCVDNFQLINYHLDYHSLVEKHTKLYKFNVLVVIYNEKMSWPHFVFTTFTASLKRLIYLDTVSSLMRCLHKLYSTFQ